MKQSEIFSKLANELLNILLCAAIALTLGLTINRQIRQETDRQIKDIQHTDWVRAAHQVPYVEMTLTNDTVK